ncbi:MAG: iron-containing alcohol dehydrogenase, partial [Pseudomonadota bacterium]
MAPFTFQTTPAIHFAEGAAAQIGEIARRTMSGNVLIVTDPGIEAAGLLDQPLQALQDAGFSPVLFNAVEADPSRDTVEAASALARSNDVTGVIGIGGGSSLDVAKLAALLATNIQRLDDCWGVGNVVATRLPLILVPTTAGTGSEVTPISIVTVEEDEKRGVVSPVILPDAAILDPLLTVGLPPHVTAATGIDAMVHAIEAATSKSANNNPVSQTLARQALALLGKNIEAA